MPRSKKVVSPRTHVDPLPAKKEVESMETAKETARTESIPGHQISLPDQSVEPLIFRIQGIEEEELLQREARLVKIGLSPQESPEVANLKYVEFLDDLWVQAKRIVAQSKDHMAAEIQKQGRTFSKSDATKMIFAYLLTQYVLNLKCVSFNTDSGLRFLPIEALEIENLMENVEIVRNYILMERQSLMNDQLEDFVWEANRIKVKMPANEEGTEETEIEARVYNARWCDGKIVLLSSELKRVIELCADQYKTYRKVRQIQENAAIFDRFMGNP
ncbi:MAG: hypothetical protein LBC11_01625 [Puniceicoccales bacterium]|jgi:hypothetical protein|nr:hypothetical protein [Puniceicoccales bacterium]